MAGIRFDDDTCGNAASGSDRRGVLKGLIAGGIVAVVGRVTGRPAAAKKKKAKGPCNGTCGSICDKRTASIVCNPANDLCLCVRSTSGKIHCGDTTTISCLSTGSPDQCKRDADCGHGAICMPTTGSPYCCLDVGEAQGNVCVPLCAEAPAAPNSGKASGSVGVDVRQRLIGR